MDIHTVNYLPITKTDTLPLKHTQLVWHDLDILEKSFHGLTKLLLCQQKAQPREMPQKWLYANYCTLNSLLPPMVKAHSKAHGVLCGVLPKIDELYAMLNDPMASSSLDCTLEYCYIALLPETQKKWAFITLIGKFKFKKVPFGLAQNPTYLQQLINRVYKGLPFWQWGHSSLWCSWKLPTHLGGAKLKTD